MLWLIPVAACLHMALVAQEGDATRTEQGIEISIKADPLETLPWLPVAATMVIENKSTEEQLIRPLELGSGLGVSIEANDGKWKSRSLPFNSPPMPRADRRTRLGSNDKKAYKVWIFWDGQKQSHSMPRPGRYVLRGEVHNAWLRPGESGEKKHFVSIEVKVRQPTGREVASGKLFAEATRGMRPSHSTNTCTAAALDALTQISNEYPDTAYGAYARYFLASCLASEFAGHGPQRARKDEASRREGLRKAVEILQGLDEEEGTPESIDIEVRLHLAQYLMWLGALGEARKSLARVDGSKLPQPLDVRFRTVSRQLSKQ